MTSDIISQGTKCQKAERKHHNVTLSIVHSDYRHIHRVRKKCRVVAGERLLEIGYHLAKLMYWHLFPDMV